MLTVSQLCQVRPLKLTTSRFYTDVCRRSLNVDFRTSRNRHFEIDCEKTLYLKTLYLSRLEDINHQNIN